ncbi:MAG: Dam family site-specific DNA-(adenine-N6)-methyltransferase [Endomicrobia bacterium]|nr:Dam family site-specific DNA-(adenine-N6)-methyltransferase [Endomicrobiia bacterium]
MRYIGTKTDLVGKIFELIKDKKINDENFTFCDVFSGTGAVGEFLKDKFRIIANDVQYYSYILSQAKLNTPDLLFSQLGFDPFDYFNSEKREMKGFIYKNYSLGGSERMYFSEENALKIDFIRSKITEWREKEKITDYEYFYLIAALLESASKVANIAGVYGSYLKTWDPRAVKPMPFIKVEQRDIKGLYNAEVHNKTIEELINDISGDILYLDPPYTKNQYSVQYHLLETIAKNDSPEIKGKGGLRDTSATASAFSRTGDVEVVFEKIIAKAKFRYIILSYNSDGLMSQKYIENVLKRYGKPETYELRKIKYKQYKNHKTTDKKEHCEYLFFIEKKESGKVHYVSPLNYQGGKYDIVDFIKNNLPNGKISRFADIFGGGYNVGINVEAEQNIYNEYNHKVVELMECFKHTETADLVKYIVRTQRKYKLERGDKKAYMKLRAKYNSIPLEKRDPKMLYMLILYGFNQQIRFNSSYDCNNPVGPAGLNDNMLEKITSFCRRMQEQNLVLISSDFEKTKEYINKDTFVYCDPPYLITLGSYNDGKRGFNGWDQSDELRLYKFLDDLNKSGNKFMMSNVLEHKRKKNILLKNWVKKNGYKVITYNKSARKGRKEVLIVNYDKENI